MVTCSWIRSGEGVTTLPEHKGYGAGDEKIGSIVNGTAADGKRLKTQFLKKTPALAKLKKAIETTLIEEAYWEGDTQKVVWKKRYHRDNNKLDITRCLIGLDGRPLHIRSPHAALNTLLQSAGALICKKWVCLVEQNLVRAGYKHGWDGDFAFMAWVHKLVVHVKPCELGETQNGQYRAKPRRNYAW